MSTFEIVRGVEDDCLVLDGTRICGPKPWGGGRIIKTFRTDGIYEVIDKDEYRKLMDDNAKLRELSKRMFGRVNYECRCCSVFCSDWDEDNECCVFATSMRELGIEVDG